MKLVILHLCARWFEARAARAMIRHKDLTARAQHFFNRIRG